MPKQMEEHLKAEAKKKFPGDQERQNAYIYGTIDKYNKKKRRKTRGRK